MQYGIAPISVAAIRSVPRHDAEMVSQVLYGEHFKVLEKRKFWSRVRLAFDGCEGWMDNSQLLPIAEEDYRGIEKSGSPCSSDLVAHTETKNGELIPILLGSNVPPTPLLSHNFEGHTVQGRQTRLDLIQASLLYLNAPYLYGGRTPFGIDGPGFVQMAYKVSGHCLFRNAKDQSAQGSVLSFIEESEPGDLAFFDDNEGTIDHVGIIMDNNYIIHAHGKVRIDRLDHTGIFNAGIGRYTHKLRVIKKVIQTP